MKKTKNGLKANLICQVERLIEEDRTGKNLSDLTDTRI